MSAAAPWLLVCGALGVPAALLLWGVGLQRRSARTRAAFRGAAAGFVMALPLVVLALVLPPLRWPPEPLLHVTLVLVGMPLAATVGALVGVLVRGRSGSAPRRGGDGAEERGSGVDQGRTPRVS